MVSERVRVRLELRSSNAAVPHRNQYRERKSGQVVDREGFDCGGDECLRFCQRGCLSLR